jgi:galactosyl transferase GMA12/MNN10 family
MYAVVSLCTSNLNDLGSLTDSLKKEYCQQHGYEFFNIGDEFIGDRTEPWSFSMDWYKPKFLLKLFNERPDILWALVTEADATITNLTIPMEDKVDNDYHVIAPTDRLSINSGNLLIRNSPEGRDYLQAMIDDASKYLTNTTNNPIFGLQLWMVDTLDKHSDIIKIVPQRHMNSYEDGIYDYCDIRTDILGTPGAWVRGDWIIHWPGIQHQVRLDRASKLEQEGRIVR